MVVHEECKSHQHWMVSSCLLFSHRTTPPPFFFLLELLSSLENFTYPKPMLLRSLIITFCDGEWQAKECLQSGHELCCIRLFMSFPRKLRCRPQDLLYNRLRDDPQATGNSLIEIAGCIESFQLPRSFGKIWNDPKRPKKTWDDYMETNF